MNINKQVQQLTERLNYIIDVFAGKYEEDISLLSGRLEKFKASLEDSKDSEDTLASLEDLFFFVECKLEDKLTPMDKVRIVRHPQRVCLRDILEFVYDNYTEIGGQDEHTNDPAILIARAYITRRRGKKTYNQSVMVIGHEKGHGEEFRNGGSAKPWGNAKALNYMKVAETEGIPIHTYIFTPGGDPIEDYPGAAQQIARNIYEMSSITVPIVAIFSEGGSGGAEALAVADKRLMFSHGYYSVISPEGAAAIEGRLKRGERASVELTEQCATNLHLTAEDNLRFGYIDKIIQEPILGVRPYHFEFFRSVRQEVIRATDEIVLSTKRFSSFRTRTINKLQDREINLDEMLVRWQVNKKLSAQLVENRQNKFLRMSRKTYHDRQTLLYRLSSAWSEQWWEIYNRIMYGVIHNNRKTVSLFYEEVSSEISLLMTRLTRPWKKIYQTISRTKDANEDSLTRLSDWDSSKDAHGKWSWVPERAKEDRTITCPNSATHGCLDLWAPDLFNEFAGVCTTCGHHFPMEYQWFLYNCFDKNSLFEFNTKIEAANPLNFPLFDEKLAEAKKKTGLKSSCITFEGRVDGIKTIGIILTGPFRGGSVGAAEGAKLIDAIERARRKKYPLILYSHGTAGIRIQEGTHGVIQMPRVTIAVRRYIEQGGLYMVIYDTNSYGGPVASFLGCANYQFAIRSSNVGFAGPAVIKNTTGVDLPPDYHNCYKALSRGHIQGVMDRRDLRANLSQALLTMGGHNLYYR